MATEKEIAAAARVAHQANKAYAESLYDFTIVDWDFAPLWQKESVIAGARAVAAGTTKTPEEQHQAWMNHKIAEGWVYGPEKDNLLKTHPCLVPYSQLSEEDKRKDLIFRAVVKALLDPIS